LLNICSIAVNHYFRMQRYEKIRKPPLNDSRILLPFFRFAPLSALKAVWPVGVTRLFNGEASHKKISREIFSREAFPEKFLT
jgi:hypothetical protein